MNGKHRGMVDVAVIGGGVFGCAAARALSRNQCCIQVLERRPTADNGEIPALICTGIESPAGTERSRLLLRGSQLLTQFCTERRIPCERLDVIIPGNSLQDVLFLREMHQRGKKNHIRGLQLLWGDPLHRQEPLLQEEVREALLVPQFVVPTLRLLQTWRAEAEENCLVTHGVGVESVRRGAFYTLNTTAGTVTARVVVDATGGAERQHLVYRIKRGEQALQHAIVPLPNREGITRLPLPEGILSGPFTDSEEQSGEIYARLSLPKSDALLLAEPEPGHFCVRLPTGEGVTLALAVAEQLAQRVTAYLSADVEKR